jgi:hypothetical protein
LHGILVLPYYKNGANGGTDIVHPRNADLKEMKEEINANLD